MKKAHLLLLLFLLPLLSFAQTNVSASEIIEKINRGEAVTYKNAIITGDLDMTQLKNMKLKKMGTEEYISTVKGPVTFIDCTFKGNVLAYFSPNNGATSLLNSSSELYNTNFESDVKFENCTFENAAAFKYSEFKGNVSFAGSRFNEEALFKYSKFSRSVNFSKARFSEEANFKYAKFDDGVNFQNATFNGLANFKYAKLTDSVNLKGTSFKRDTDFKYTKLNNRSVSLASLQSK